MCGSKGSAPTPSGASTTTAGTSSGMSTGQLAQGPTPATGARYEDFLNQVGGLASTPFNPSILSQVAPLTDFQTQGLNQLFNLGMTEGTFDPTAVHSMESPYTEDVVNATQDWFNNQNAIQGSQLLSTGIQKGNAFGGDRMGIAEAQLAGQQQLAQAPVIAGLRQAGYTQALNEYNQLKQLGLAGAGQAVTAGTVQQAQQQRELDVATQNAMLQQAYPFQLANWWGSALGGIGPLTGTVGAATTSTTGSTTGISNPPTPNPLTTALGIGSTVAGLFSKDGGTVPARFQDGGFTGSIDESGNLFGGDFGGGGGGGFNQPGALSGQQQPQQSQQPQSTGNEVLDDYLQGANQKKKIANLTPPLRVDKHRKYYLQMRDLTGATGTQQQPQQAAPATNTSTSSSSGLSGLGLIGLGALMFAKKGGHIPGYADGDTVTPEQAADNTDPERLQQTERELRNDASMLSPRTVTTPARFERPAAAAPITLPERKPTQQITGDFDPMPTGLPAPAGLPELQLGLPGGRSVPAGFRPPEGLDTSAPIELGEPRPLQAGLGRARPQPTVGDGGPRAATQMMPGFGRPEKTYAQRVAENPFFNAGIAMLASRSPYAAEGIAAGLRGWQGATERGRQEQVLDATPKMITQGGEVVWQWPDGRMTRTGIKTTQQQNAEALQAHREAVRTETARHNRAMEKGGADTPIVWHTPEGALSAIRRPDGTIIRADTGEQVWPRVAAPAAPAPAPAPTPPAAPAPTTAPPTGIQRPPPAPGSPAAEVESRFPTDLPPARPVLAQPTGTTPAVTSPAQNAIDLATSGPTPVRTDEEKDTAAAVLSDGFKFKAPANLDPGLLQAFSSTPEQFDFNAQRLALGDTSVLQGITGKQASKYKLALRNRAAQYYIDQGLPPERANAAVAEFAAKRSGARLLANREATLTSAITAFEGTAPVLLDISDKIQRTDYPALNNVIMAFQKGTGDQNVVRLATAVETLINNYAAALGRGNGVLTDNAKQHARELLDRGFSQGQMGAAVDQMMIEMDREKQKIGQGLNIYLGKEKEAPYKPGSILQRNAPATGGGGSGWTRDKAGNYYNPQGKKFSPDGRPLD